MTEGPPSLDIQGACATIRLRRPSVHNRLHDEDIDVLGSHLRAVAARKDVRALVLKGSGGATFCAGYNLVSLVDSLDARFEQLLDALEALGVPVIAALNGNVYGGGVDLALCCDLRLGVDGMRIRVPATQIGLHFYPGGVRRLVSTLGIAEAKRVLLTSRSLEGPQLLRNGFLHDMVRAEELDAMTQSYVDSILECDPIAVGSTKAHLNEAARDAVNVGAHRALFEESIRSARVAERIARASRS